MFSPDHQSALQTSLGRADRRRRVSVIEPEAKEAEKEVPSGPEPADDRGARCGDHGPVAVVAVARLSAVEVDRGDHDHGAKVGGLVHRLLVVVADRGELLK